MIKSSLHNHCDFCDGVNSAEEMVKSAIEAGFSDFGMSCHCNDDKFEFSLQDEQLYIETMAELKKKYEKQIRLYCGIEQDPYGNTKNLERFDYVIGSVHNLPIVGTDRFFCVDGSKGALWQGIVKAYDGDGLKMVKDYYATVVENCKTVRPDIIGHFDLVLKLNEDNCFFDENSEEYIRIATDALEKCAALNLVFELNTGGVFRGYRDFPYLQSFLLKRLRELEAKVTISTDCHSINGIRFGIRESLDLLESIGFDRVSVWQNGEFVQAPIQENKYIFTSR